MLKVTGLVGMMLLVGAAVAQAPAGAPAGASGICKDGTYSLQATKDGACRGHKGVQTWYRSAPAVAAPTPAAAPTAVTPARGNVGAPAAMPAPVQAQSAPAVAPANTPAKPGVKAERAKLDAMQPAVGGGPGLVWVNGSSKVYHCQGSEFYGKTKTGSYMSESDAKAKGAHADHGKPCS